ncbi:hypothetical protein ACVV5W_14210, partial [Enterococcus faecalis]
MIYQTLTQSQTKELKKESRNYISMYNNGKQNEIKNIANNQENLIVIKKNDKTIFTTDKNSSLDGRIDNEANPSNLIHKNTKLGLKYTFKSQIGDKTVYISGINDEILDLQKEMWKYLSIVGIIVLITEYLASRSI